MKFAAIVFDLDGTLIDSLPDVVCAINRLLAEENRRPLVRAEAANMVGGGAAPLVDRAFAETGAAIQSDRLPALIDRFVGHYSAAPAENTIIYPGVLETLDYFASQGFAMGICTNKPHNMSLLVTRTIGLDKYFSAIIGGGALPVNKPDPAHLKAVIERLDCGDRPIVYVGDSPTDVATARNASVPVIAVSYGYSKVPPTQLGADGLIDNFADLPRALEALVIHERG